MIFEKIGHTDCLCDPAAAISTADVSSAVDAATKDVEAQVFAPISGNSQTPTALILDAMSRLDEDEVRLRDVARVADKASSYVGVHAERLREAGVIHADRW